MRRALSEAIDRDFITRKLLRAGQVPAYSFVPPGTANYTAGPKTAWAGMPLVQRQIEARALLAQLGYNARRPLKLEIKTQNATDSLLQAEGGAGRLARPSASTPPWRRTTAPSPSPPTANRDFQGGAP